MVYKQKASWKCEPEEGFIYLENNDINESGLGSPEFLGTNAVGDDEKMVSEDQLTPAFGWVPKEMPCWKDRIEVEWWKKFICALEYNKFVFQSKQF